MNSEKIFFIPGLYVVSTPLGNLGDISPRSSNILESSDYILCEDTRITSKLINHLKIKTKLVSYHKFNENKEIDKVIKDLINNKIVSLVSDAGTPSLSDPGKNLIQSCYENLVKVFPVPGPSAITAAMSISGFNDQFYFCGFLPKKQKEIEKKLESLKKIDASIVFFLPARDLGKYEKFFKIFFPNSKFLIAREMTKIHETYIRDDVNNLSNYIHENQKGEMTLVITNTPEKEFEVDLDKEIKLLIGKMSSKDISEYLSKKLDINRKSIYQKVLQINV